MPDEAVVRTDGEPGVPTGSDVTPALAAVDASQRSAGATPDSAAIAGSSHGGPGNSTLPVQPSPQTGPLTDPMTDPMTAPMTAPAPTRAAARTRRGTEGLPSPPRVITQIRSKVVKPARSRKRSSFG